MGTVPLPWAGTEGAKTKLAVCSSCSVYTARGEAMSEHEGNRRVLAQCRVWKRHQRSLSAGGCPPGARRNLPERLRHSLVSWFLLVGFLLV